LTNSFFIEAGVFAEFVNGDEISWLFVVPVADLGKDLSGGAFFPTCYIADVFSIDDYASWYNFLHNAAIAVPLLWFSNMVQ
jgi:hypothetical protein